MKYWIYGLKYWKANYLPLILFFLSIVNLILCLLITDWGSPFFALFVTLACLSASIYCPYTMGKKFSSDTASE